MATSPLRVNTTTTPPSPIDQSTRTKHPVQSSATNRLTTTWPKSSHVPHEHSISRLTHDILYTGYMKEASWSGVGSFGPYRTNYKSKRGPFQRTDRYRCTSSASYRNSRPCTTPLITIRRRRFNIFVPHHKDKPVVSSSRRLTGHR